MQTAVIKPSSFPRDEKFRSPHTPPFRDDQGTFHVFSHADVMRALKNADQEFSQDLSTLVPDDHHMTFDFMWATDQVTLAGEPGRHDALRAVVEPWFRTRAVRTMEPVIRHLARELVEEIVQRGTGEFDLANDLAYRLSMRVICKLTGIELEREQWMREKLDEFNRAADFTKIPRQWDVAAYFWELVAKRLAHPQDELLDVLISAWKEDKISGRELLGFISGFVNAGTDTTGTSLVDAVALLAEFDYLDQVRRSLDDQEAMRRIIEEILRFSTPFPAGPISVVRDVTFGDLRVPAGSHLNMWLSAANRDEAVNGGVQQTDPNVFDPDRWPNRHVALGQGRHYCLGGELARLEIRILLEEVLLRLPGLHMAEDQPFERVVGIVDAVTAAPFRFDSEQAQQVMRSPA